jgi:hypothetical protein
MRNQALREQWKKSKKGKNYLVMQKKTVAGN